MGFVTTATAALRRRLLDLSDWAWCSAHLRWIPTWKRYDPDFKPAGAAPEFVSARSAAALIPDGAVVAGAGMGAHGRASTLYFAIRDRYRTTGHPAGLTWIHCGGAGGRGRLPGTLDDLADPGLLRMVVTGHTQTVPALRALAAAGKLHLHLLPQGVLSFLIEGQGQGRRTLRSKVGVGTFMDTRVGSGSALCASDPSLAVPDGDALEYRIPAIDTAVFYAPWADLDGNIYFDGAACLTEMADTAAAARANGGRVVVMVAAIRPDAENLSRPALTAAQVDAIVVSSRAEQTASVRQRRQWDAFLPGGCAQPDRMLARIDILDRLLGVAPTRTPADRAVARLAATLIMQHANQDALVNIGTGLPEEAARILCESGAHEWFRFTIESGVLGGIPVPGGLFGVALSPEALHSSSWMFHRYETDLAVTCLGMLEFDGDGNVNVSRTGPGPQNSIGPGGFMDIATGARVVVFVGAWRRGGHTAINLHGDVLIDPSGKPKLVAHVRETTFDAVGARLRGQTIYYVTTVGAFQLGEDGLVLTHVMPGVDIDRDILTVDPSITVIAGGPVRLGADVTTGRGFRLSIPDRCGPTLKPIYG